MAHLGATPRDFFDDTEEAVNATLQSFSVYLLLADDDVLGLEGERVRLYRAETLWRCLLDAHPDDGFLERLTIHGKTLLRNENSPQMHLMGYGFIACAAGKILSHVPFSARTRNLGRGFTALGRLCMAKAAKPITV